MAADGATLAGQVLAVTLPVFGIAAVGFLYGRLNGADMDSANRVNMNLFVPALLFYVLTEKIAAPAAWGLVGGGTVAVVVGSGLLVWPLTRLLGEPPRVVLPSVMFNNSGNLGLPLALLAFGQEVLPLVVVTFVVSTALHFTLGIWLVSGRLHPALLLRNPVFLATAAGLACSLTGLHLPAILLPGLEMLSQVAIPLMLVALGVRLTAVSLAHWRVGLAVALLRPAAGLLCGWLAVQLLGLTGEAARVLLLFSALPPAVMNFLLAERYATAPAEVASMVALGNLASLLVIPAVLAFLL